VFQQASILLVDDDPEVREAIASMLQELGHRVVAAAATIRDASAFAMIAEFDLAILNINIEGYRIDPVAHLVQRRSRPILFVTGDGTRWLPSLFRGQTVLQKPASIEMLNDAIDQIIGQHASEE
jgi:DNA-binding response OmpR family regulator